MNKIIAITVMLLLLVSPCIADETEENSKKDNGLSPLTIMCEKTNTAQIKIYGALTINDAQMLWDDFFILKHKTEIRNIEVFVASPGGSSFGGFSIIAIIKKMQEEGFKLTVYGTGVVGSMAIPIYAVCGHRIAYPGTIFMVHPATIQNPQAMQESDLDSQRAFHDMTKDKYVSVLTEYTKLPKEEWLEKIKKDTWFSAEQAKEWGLVDEIR